MTTTKKIGSGLPVVMVEELQDGFAVVLLSVQLNDGDRPPLKIILGLGKTSGEAKRNAERFIEALDSSIMALP